MGEPQLCPLFTAHVKKGAKGGPPKGKSGSAWKASDIWVSTRLDHRSSGSVCPS